MFDEEEGIITYEVESGGSIDIIHEMPEIPPKEL